MSSEMAVPAAFHSMFDAHFHINPEPMKPPMKKSPDYSESLLVHFRRLKSLKEAALDYPVIP